MAIMKFGKLLQDFSKQGVTPASKDEDHAGVERREEEEAVCVAEVPGGVSKDFVRYKEMKKLLKKAAECKEKGDDEGMRAHEKEFIRLLYDDVDRINSYFMEEEEDHVIKLQELQDLYSGEKEKVGAIRSRFIDLHGELVLLLHWSIVNYAGILKILKKHDKLLGGHAQKDLVGSILQQPFTSTDSITKLVSTAEVYVKKLSEDVGEGGMGKDDGGTKESGVLGKRLMRDDSVNELVEEAKRFTQYNGGNAVLLEKTTAALDMLKQLQSTAHSPSTFVSVQKCARVPADE